MMNGKMPCVILTLDDTENSPGFSGNDSGEHDISHLSVDRGKTPHVCNFCNKSFTHKGNLKSHLLTHSGEKPHACIICNKSFTQKGSLQSHLLTHSEKKPHACIICNKSFTQKGSLQSHLLTHRGEKPHACIMCNKSFTTKAHLKSHLLTHSGEKPHACIICNKSFNRKENLKKHLLTHSGEKPHVCSICNKSFTENGSLKRHLLTHIGEKPYECNICNKSFTENGSLKRHLFSHREKPFTCDVCKKSFTWKTDLGRHMRTHTVKRSYRCIAGESFVNCKKNNLHQNGRIQCKRNDEYFHSSVNGKDEIPSKSSATASVLTIETSKLNCINNTEMSQAKSLKVTGPEIMKEEFDSLSISDTDYTEAVEKTPDIAAIDSVVDYSQLLCLECGENYRNGDDYKRHSCYTERLCSEATNENADFHEDNVSKVELDEDDIHGTGSINIDNCMMNQMDNLNHDERYVESSSQDLDMKGVTQGNPLAIPSPKFLTNCRNNHPTRILHCNNCECCKNAIYAYYEYLVVTDWLSQS